MSVCQVRLDVPAELVHEQRRALRTTDAAYIRPRTRPRPRRTQYRRSARA
jgi:hypothetical protein